MSLPARWPFAWSRSPWGASGRSRSPEWASSRSRSPQEASGWSRSRSRSPQWASDWRRPPQWASSRSQTAREPSGWRRSSQGGFSRRPSSQGGSSRSRPAGRGRSRLATSSRSKTHNGTGTRDQPSKRSPSPQGATSRSPSPQGATSRSPSPQGATSRSPSPEEDSSRSRPCPKMSREGASEMSPSVTDDVTGASTTSTGADVDPGALSSHEPHDGLYGVMVSNFADGLTHLDIKSFLTERFMHYGNVCSVIVRGSVRPSYVLVFYTQKHEQEKALSADTMGPHGSKFEVTIWSGPSPYIFGILITNIDGNDLDLRHRITAEFGIFGDINLVKIGGSTQERIALVSYKYRHGQQNALASPSPIKTSFGKVTVTAWNKRPPAWGDMPVYNVPSLQESSSSRSPSPQESSSSRSPSPQESSSSRSPSPQESSSSRSPSPQESSSSRSPSPQESSSSRSPSPQEAFSRSPSPQGAFSRSPSPQRNFSQSRSPQGVSRRRRSSLKMSRKRNNGISPSVAENITGASTGADVDPGALSSHEPPVGLYGVKVSNFASQLTSTHIRLFLTERFMYYGNVMCVTVHGNDRSRYSLVFYKQKHEQMMALVAGSKGPYGVKFSVTPWSGPSPSIFGILITNIDGNDSDLRRRIVSDFGIFGDIASVKIRGSMQERIALVFYQYRKGQERALASPKPFKTSFGNVTLTAWNKPPPARGEMPF